jgi:hypothetical protein
MGSFDRRLLIALILLLGAVGCAQDILNGGSGIYARVPVGSVLRLHERIPIPAERARVWFKGDSLSLGAGSYESVCAIEVTDINWVETQYVEPGEFRIRKVQNMWTEVVRSRTRPVAAVRFQLASYGSDGGNPLIHEGYHFWLESKDQPNVMRLTCVGVFEDMPEARPPTLADIRASLGRYATLELAVASEKPPG